jgi:hypothetical protein
MKRDVVSNVMLHKLHLVTLFDAGLKKLNLEFTILLCILECFSIFILLLTNFKNHHSGMRHPFSYGSRMALCSRLIVCHPDFGVAVLIQKWAHCSFFSRILTLIHESPAL